MAMRELSIPNPLTYLFPFVKQMGFFLRVSLRKTVIYKCCLAEQQYILHNFF